MSTEHMRGPLRPFALCGASGVAERHTHAGDEVTCITCLAMMCSCGVVKAGYQAAGMRCWSEMCPVHGVGTRYFQELETLPFGYAEERDTTRAEWLAYQDSIAEEYRIENERAGEQDNG